MMRFIYLLFTFFLTANSANAEKKNSDLSRPLRPVHTYSIVARDPQTGEMGVAVQSHWFAVGRLVLWGKAGVGVVATQSFIERRYGSSGLKLMEEGWSADQALNAIKGAILIPRFGKWPCSTLLDGLLFTRVPTALNLQVTEWVRATRFKLI